MLLNEGQRAGLREGQSTENMAAIDRLEYNAASWWFDKLALLPFARIHSVSQPSTIHIPNNIAHIIMLLSHSEKPKRNGSGKRPPSGKVCWLYASFPKGPRQRARTIFFAGAFGINPTRQGGGVPPLGLQPRVPWTMEHLARSLFGWTAYVIELRIKIRLYF